MLGSQPSFITFLAATLDQFEWVFDWLEILNCKYFIHNNLRKKHVQVYKYREIKWKA